MNDADYLANQAEVRHVLDEVRPSLTDSQVAQVETDIAAGECLLAVEFILQFVDQNGVYLSRTAHDMVQACMQRHGKPGSPVACYLHPRERTPAEAAATRATVKGAARAILSLLAPYLTRAELERANDQIGNGDPIAVISAWMTAFQTAGLALPEPVQLTADSFLEHWRKDRDLMHRQPGDE